MSKRFVKFRDDADRKRFRAALADIVACQYAPREPLLAHAGAVPQSWASQLCQLHVCFASGDPILQGTLLDGRPVGVQAFKEAHAEAMENQRRRLAAMASAGVACV